MISISLIICILGYSDINHPPFMFHSYSYVSFLFLARFDDHCILHSHQLITRLAAHGKMQGRRSALSGTAGTRMCRTSTSRASPVPDRNRCSVLLWLRPSLAPSFPGAEGYPHVNQSFEAIGKADQALIDTKTSQEDSPAFSSGKNEYPDFIAWYE